MTMRLSHIGCLLLAVVALLLVVSLLSLNEPEGHEYGPHVVAVYPSSDMLPANILRLYVQFSEPMKTVDNLEHIKILDQSGVEVPYVFFNNVYELWNHEQTQLTLIVDPARVKSGLEAHEALGRAFVPDETYTLILTDLENVFHQKMSEPYKKAFSVTVADLTAPDLERWQLETPPPDTVTALTVTFPDALDYMSLQQRLVVTTSDDEPVDGVVSVVEQETTWQFIPAEPWMSGEYNLHVNTRLEDPAGNNLNGLFDHTADGLQYETEGVIETIPFIVN